MIRFNNDYNRGAHPRVIEALVATNAESHPGYGLDAWCERGAQAIRAQAEAPEAAVHFVVGGTQANFLVIASALRPYQSVISADTGHINEHETGAVEHVGHKIQALPGTDGKIAAAQVEEVARDFETSTVPEHIVQPKMVYLSYTSEFGTLYSKRELEDLSAVCREHGLYLFVDGARLSYGLAAPESDVTMADLARLTDAFTVGGTKCGALFGEAIVLANPALHEGFRSNMKQNGAMLAKGWLLGLQFATLFESAEGEAAGESAPANASEKATGPASGESAGEPTPATDGRASEAPAQEPLYLAIARQADEQALRIKATFAQAGVPFFIESPTNQQFVVMPDRVLDDLAKKYVFEYEQRIDDAHSCVRFCTSWSTKPEDVDALVADIEALARAGKLA